MQPEKPTPAEDRIALPGGWQPSSLAPKDGSQSLWRGFNRYGARTYAVIQWPEFDLCFEEGEFMPIPGDDAPSRPTSEDRIALPEGVSARLSEIANEIRAAGAGNCVATYYGAMHDAITAYVAAAPAVATHPTAGDAALADVDPVVEDVDGWKPADTYKHDGRPIYTLTFRCVKWTPYRPDGQRQMKAKGRWQEAGEHGGWQNCASPTGPWHLAGHTVPDALGLATAAPAMAAELRGLRALAATLRAQLDTERREGERLRKAAEPFVAFARALLPSLRGDKRAISHEDDETGPTAWRHISYGDIRELALAAAPAQTVDDGGERG